MKAVAQKLRTRALEEKDYLDGLNREIVPVLAAVRELVNRLAAAPEQDAGAAGATETLDWSAYHYRALTLSQTCTLTFIAPTGAAELVLKVTQDSVGAWGITWPSTMRWEGGTPPVLTGTAASVDLVRIYCDGTLYYGTAWLDFQP